jgi:hypothetical protein
MNNLLKKGLLNKSEGVKVMKEIIRARALLGLPLTKRQRAMFILFYGTSEEVEAFLKLEKEVI